MRLCKNLKLRLAVMTVLSVILAACTLVAPLLLGTIIDSMTEGFVGGGYDKAVAYLIVLAILYALTAIFSWVVTAWSASLSQEVVAAVRVALFEKTNRLAFKELDSRSEGDMLARSVSDVEALAEGILQGASHFITDIILIAGTIGFLIYINIFLALVVIALTPLSALAAALVARAGQKYFARQAQYGGEMTGQLAEYIGGVKTVKAFSLVSDAEQCFEKINNKFSKAGVQATFCSTLVNPSARLVNNLIFACVAAVGGIMCVNDGLSVGLLSAALAYVYQYGKPFNELSGIFSELQKASAASKRIQEILDLPEEVQDEDLKVKELQRFTGNVELDSVSFSYTEKPFMQDFTFRAEAGQKIAIVGHTGSGKTTLINLLMRFYDTTGGSIKIDGIDIKKMPREVLRKNIGMVLQESWLFEGTVAQNIAYGKQDASKQEIVEAAKRAYAHEFICKLQKDYDTMISENSSLSDGQRQQIALARVMLADTPILIFDEATSNLDAKTEENIVRAISEISKHRTTFVVAHRLTTVQSADLVLVVNEGKIIERGTHAQLLSQGGFYKNLYEKQLVDNI